MLLADYAVVSDGKLTIVGGGWSQTGPEPASFGIGLAHPGAVGPGEHACTRSPSSCSTPTAAPVGFEDDEDDDQAVAFGGEFEVGRPPGLKPGTPLDFPVAVNSTPLPLEPGRYEWRLTIDGESREDWTTAVHRARRGAVARLESVRPTGLRPARDVCSKRVQEPTRIDLLELDIDLRLADLWREAVDVSDWSLEVVAAFIRAAYGKGYCDALTEESPGSLCVEHGYRMPDRRVPPSATPRKRLRQRLLEALGPTGLDSPRGTEGESGAARDRALGGGGARRLPPVHVDRRRRKPVDRSERARRAAPATVQLAGVVVGPVARRRARRRPSLQAARTSAASARASRRRSVHGIRARSLQGRAPHRGRRPAREAARSSPSPAR